MTSAEIKASIAGAKKGLRATAKAVGCKVVFGDMNKQQAKKWMRRNVEVATDQWTGEVNMTQLAEACAAEADQGDWLDEETHWVWDLAFEVSETTRA